MEQRRHLLVAAGLVAASAGLGLAWWQSQRKETARSEPVQGFWAMQWEQPGGGSVRAQSWQGKPVLINFWATWCPPCIEELPLINDFYLKNKANGWQVVGLAVDKLASVQSFLQRLPLDFPVGMASMSGTELGRNLGNLTGGLPFTVVLDATGTIAQRKLGRVSADDLRSWAALK
jgi:thiol-disulfide isomerase/thioredoxin